MIFIRIDEITRQTARMRQITLPEHPVAIGVIAQTGVMMWAEGREGTRQRIDRRTLEGVINLAHDPERVLVKTAPDVQPVLLDAVPGGRITPRRTLATQPPAGLIDGDVVLILPAGAIGDTEHRGHCRAATAEHHQFFFGHRKTLKRYERINARYCATSSAHNTRR